MLRETIILILFLFIIICPAEKIPKSELTSSKKSGVNTNGKKN